jgi:hypothetical protein
MIAKPTTQQVLLDCCRQLTDVVLPAVDDETVKVTVLMLDLVLRNAAMRSAHEVAWMEEEVGALQQFARDVAASSGAAPGVQAALDDAAAGSGTSLHLDDVVERYRLASEAFSRALEAAVASGDQALAQRGVALLSHRMERETEIMSGWSPVGR